MHAYYAHNTIHTERDLSHYYITQHIEEISRLYK